ncbi:MAG: DUF6261 family protein [Tannerella sp.]|nr:DUF6261 family protein [Tannerella sp.]
MKILKIHFSYLRNEAHYQFLLLVKKLFEDYPGVAGIVNILLTQFYTLLTLEGKLVDAVRTSGYTEQLVKTDKRLNRAVTGLSLAIETASHHPDPNIVKAAGSLIIRMKAFRNGIKQKAYEEKSGAVKILITDLQSAYAPQVSTLGLGVWVTEIITAQATFEQLFLLRSAEHVEQPQGCLKDVRIEIDTIYRQAMERIEGYTAMNGTDVTGIFINKLNDETAYFNRHYRHRRVPKDINLATVASIPVQPWNGRPVTPLPSVTDEDGNELFFGRDYDLKYHNNDCPGNATVTLQGRSAWKGKKTVSFNIVKNDGSQLSTDSF